MSRNAQKVFQFLKFVNLPCKEISLSLLVWEDQSPSVLLPSPERYKWLGEFGYSELNYS